LFKGGRNLDDVLEEVRNGVQIELVVTDLGAIANTGGARKAGRQRPRFLRELHDRESA
jgi:hypothetical protein